MFYKFKQNNSGGYFVDTEHLGTTVLIESDSSEKATERAEEFGIYFDGVMKGADCDCCGDRWERNPEEISDPAEFAKQQIEDYNCSRITVIHKDGHVESFVYTG